MKDLFKLYNECLSDIKTLKIPIGKIDNIEINKRASRRYGLCKYSNSRKNSYTIEISSFLLDDTVDDMAIKNTIMHEILHTVQGCMNHKSKWKEYASLVNNANIGYNIKRTTPRSEKGLKPREVKHKKSTVKFTFKCLKCGLVLYRTKLSKFVRRYSYYTCGKCGGPFEKIYDWRENA